MPLGASRVDVGMRPVDVLAWIGSRAEGQNATTMRSYTAATIDVGSSALH